MPTLPADRNLTGELGHVGYGGVLGSTNQALGATYDNLVQFGPAFADRNLENYGRTLVGSQADYSGGTAGLMRQGWQVANPELAGYATTLGDFRGQLDAQGAARYDPTGYTQGNVSAATIGPAAMAGQQRARAQYASGGPLLGQLEMNAAGALGQVSPLQLQQQRMAMSLLNAGGGLTSGELADAQDSARSAYADRGMLRSNRGIGAEILSTDQARRSRLVQNLGLAQGIDAAGQQQLNANRQYALGVQGQRQNLSQFNAGLGTGVSQFNAAQGNALGQFNAAQQNAQMQFGAGLEQQARLANQAAYNQSQQFNAGTVNDAGRFNATLSAQNQNDQWGRAMQLGQFQQAQAINPYAVAGTIQGQMPDYTGAMLGYGSDLYNTNYNAQMARYNSAKNNSAGMWGSALGAIGTIGGAIVGGPVGAAIGARLGGAAGNAIGGG